MCEDCWQKAGNPRIDNENVREAAKLADAVYAYSLVGGDLHVQLDDWNLEDDFWNLEELMVHNWTDSPEQLEAEVACLMAFKALSYDERASALALVAGFWKP